ncbi:capsular polysaccharide biosynthesis protein [Aliiroseovarius sp. YM-037]|uniref:capsular polysaccharide biosynthesis protein n=1 Tax=Aliiroseovarius sp. YM-037 TaxID=3341728 RepID=UPI003A7FF92C
MSVQLDLTTAADTTPRQLFVYSGGFLTDGRIRRILELSGYKIRLGRPGDNDLVGVWGKSPTSPRGEAVAERRDAPILRVEDTFLRSVHPGRSGSAPIGLNLDTRGVHFDPSAPSDLEHLLATHPLDDTAMLNRARDAVDRIKDAHLSKYNAFDSAAPVPDPGYVLVIDQTRGDASVTSSGATEATFREMLVFAQTEHPDARILIKTHPETLAGHRDGYFDQSDATGRVRLFDEAVSPWPLLEGARAVYTVSSQFGFEAIYAGHKPRVFGQPFYAGWGLTQDENPVPRRERQLSRAQLFAAAMILYPTWYDPYRDKLCELEDAISTLEAEARAWRDDRNGHIAVGMRLWKRAALQKWFGGAAKLRFENDPDRAAASAREQGRSMLVWASKETEALRSAADDVPVLRVEDGFVRSKGLGAQLVPALSLVVDDLGIYYDPTRESRLERLIAARVDLSPACEARVRKLIRRLTSARISKYNLDAHGITELPKGHRIAVIGQVEDDASIRLGCGEVKTNLDLLKAARAANPDAVILYKPHPDVEAELRAGAIAETDALPLADVILTDTDPIALIDAVDRVWTMTSLLGLEALLRGTAVTCLGAPFYAGWGLTNDRGPVTDRRTVNVGLEGLVHATLIDYPRYLDPVTGRPCPVEVIVDRLKDGQLPNNGPFNRALSKLQGIFASYAHLWR